MKKLRALIVLLAMIGLPLLTIADEPGPPPPPGHPGAPGNSGQTPVGAPIDGGIGILLALGMGYGGYKLYRLRKENQEEPAS